MAELHNDIGHGINTYPPSKGVPEMPEFEFNNVVGKEVKQLLKGKIDTFEGQPFDGKDVPLITRTNQYNARWLKDKTAIGISNHANASSDKNARGFGVFYWHTSKEAKRLAEIILEEYKKEFPDRKEYPIWGTGLFPCVPNTWTDFHMCRETKGVFVLVEWEFFTNKDALKLLKSNDYRKRCALINAKSVCRWYNIKWEEEPEKEKEVVKPDKENEVKKDTPKPGTSYRVPKATPGYVTAADAKAEKNKKTTVKTGTYFVYKTVDGMINVTTKNGTPGSWINPNSDVVVEKKPVSFKAGQKVKVKSTASKYATGQSIPSWVKGKSYTIQQVKSDRVLLKEIVSWVKISDLQ